MFRNTHWKKGGKRLRRPFNRGGGWCYIRGYYGTSFGRQGYKNSFGKTRPFDGRIRVWLDNKSYLFQKTERIGLLLFLWFSSFVI